MEEERGNSIDALRERGEQAQQIGKQELASDSPITMSVDFASATENSHRPQKKLNILLWASPPATQPTNSLVRRERNIYSEGNRNWGNYGGLLFGCLLNEDIPIQGIFRHCTYGYNGFYKVHSGGSKGLRAPWDMATRVKMSQKGLAVQKRNSMSTLSPQIVLSVVNTVRKTR